MAAEDHAEAQHSEAPDKFQLPAGARSIWQGCVAFGVLAGVISPLWLLVHFLAQASAGSGNAVAIELLILCIAVVLVLLGFLFFVVVPYTRWWFSKRARAGRKAKRFLRGATIFAQGRDESERLSHDLVLMPTRAALSITGPVHTVQSFRKLAANWLRNLWRIELSFIRLGHGALIAGLIVIAVAAGLIH